VISAFGPEVIGENVEGKVLATATAEYSGRTYYQFELEPPHIFITATAAGNRLYLFSVTANGETTALITKLYGFLWKIYVILKIIMFFWQGCNGRGTTRI
jgi:hypothetical protein